jgi:2-oxoglutarate ferredoxin oxidoreductase subunit alpha
LRLRALPAAEEVKDFINKHTMNYVVELNRDGQLKVILQSELQEGASRLRSLAHLDGLPLSANWLVNALNDQKEAE